MHLTSTLRIKSGMHSDAGPNEANDDCLGLRVPRGMQLASKGIAAVIADGVSAAESGKQAAEICVQGFLNDYYDAPEAWTVKTCGSKVALALNRWLFGLGQSHSRDGRGYVSTFTAVVLKGQSAHLFHVGDTRVYRLRAEQLEQLTRDHSFSFGKGGTGLARAMGMDSNVELEACQANLQVGDVYLLSSDGVHGFLNEREITRVLLEQRDEDAADGDAVCRRLCAEALAKGSNDNCSALLLEIEALGPASLGEHERSFNALPFPPELAPGMKMDGYEIEREIQSTRRSQTYLARERETGTQVVVKTPSVTFEDDRAYIERFVMEAWIARKLKHPHLLAGHKPIRGQQFLYTLFEYLEGETLEDWMRRCPKPDARLVTVWVRQVLQGLRAMHRQEMLHQDLKPSNVILHPERGAVIIDYGSTRVGGIHEMGGSFERDAALGTLGYSAPEYFLGRAPTRQSDLFSLGVMAYEALTGKHPYGEAYERCRTRRDFSLLEYRPATRFNAHVPVWLDGALKKAVAVNPQLRYESFSEFEYDLEHPNPGLLPDDGAPFIERHPLRFWKLVAGVLALSQVAMLLWWAMR